MLISMKVTEENMETQNRLLVLLYEFSIQSYEKNGKPNTDEMNLTLYWVVDLDSSTEAQITVLSSSNREENKINK